MIELEIKKYLDGQLNVPSFFEHQAKMPERFIIIEKVNGRKHNWLKGSTFAFQSYAETMYEAALLNDRLKEVVEGLIGLSLVYSVSLNSDYHFSDTDTKRYRYQAVFDIKHY